MLAIPERNHAAGYPPEVVDYSHWNAHSIFFLDPAGNIVEYIARHDLNDGDASPFSWGDILYASEIGLIVDDVKATAAMVGETAAVTRSKGGSDDLRAMGDESRTAARHEARTDPRTSRPIRTTARTFIPRGSRSAGQRPASSRLGPIRRILNVEERCACG